MAVETFTWCEGLDSTGTPGYRTRSSKFGDGFEQVVGDGINNITNTWSLSFVVNETDALMIKDFLDRHGGYKSFLWTPPLSGVGFYRASAPAITPKGAGFYTLTSTFTQSPMP